MRLTSAPTGTVTITPHNDGLTTESPTPLTFDATNWYVPQVVTVTPVSNPDPTLLHPGTKQFAVQPHLLSDIKGPLSIEGGEGAQVHPLIEAVVLPGETNPPVFPIAPQPPEEQSIDILNVFDNSSMEDKKGTLTGTQLTGYDMSTGLHFDHTAFGENADFAAGVTYGKKGVGGAPDTSNIEVFNLLMGSGNNSLDITSTLNTSALHGGLTTIHGGGNLDVQAAVAGVYTGNIAGDRITVTGGGGPTSPLVIYGDTSQDASWYAGRPYDADVNDTFVLGPNPAQPDMFYRLPRANPFDHAGNDVIDASADTPAMGALGGDALGIIIYGGGGDDTITGTQLGDVLAGGSGNDTISGQGGDDQIYGDSGVNIDVISRVLSVPTTDAARPGNDNPTSNRDGLVAGKDTIFGDSGNDIVFGDHGIVAQMLPPEQKILNVRAIEDLGTDQPANGAPDEIHGNAGRDRIFGGNGADTITGDGDPDVIFGDQGHMSYVAADYFGQPDFDLSTLDLIESVDTQPIYGAGDMITDDASDDIIIGGQGNDVIDAGGGQNIVFGDHGRLLGVDAGANTPVIDANIPTITKADDDYQMQVLGLVTSIDAGTINGAANEFGNGDDTIITGSGRDMIFGGGGNDIINTFNSGGAPASADGNNIVFGDHGLVDYLAEELANPLATNPVRTNDIDRIWSVDTALGGNDDIRTGNRNDIVIGGFGNDTIDTGQGFNIALGDSGRLTSDDTDASDRSTIKFAVHDFTICKIETSSDGDFSEGGVDTITGSDQNDVIFGGAGSDVIYAGAGNDLVFGDQGMIECENNHPFDPVTSLRPICYDLFPAGDPRNGFLEFSATQTTTLAGSGDDTIYGQDGDDLIMGEQGKDTLYGGNGDDILIGGSNVAGSLDSDDRIDGGGGNDAIAGDNADICYRPDDIDPRYRVLSGLQIYPEPGVAGATAAQISAAGTVSLATLTPQSDPSHTTQYHILLLDDVINDGLLTTDTLATTPNNLYGNDYIAGGAGNDEIFGQLGNDVIQGDGTIGVAAGSTAAQLAAAQLSLQLAVGGNFTLPTGFTTFGANRGTPATAQGSFDFSANSQVDLQVNASFEGALDGSDYIEGNGGQDVIFGNLGQDDIIGGSSDLYNLTARSQRPDGADLIFGGAGTDISLGNIGDATVDANGVVTVKTDGHALNSDTIIGDNGRMLRLVGINGVARGTGAVLSTDAGANNVASTDGLLNYNYDNEGIGTGAGYHHIVVRAVELLDYTPGGTDVNPAAAKYDIGGNDEVHGESGDDFIYGMKGADALYGDGQNDDIIGGYGNDWISGGTGDDGVLGDDGRIYTSRNTGGNGTTFSEPLNNIKTLLTTDPDTKNANGNVLNEFIYTPGNIQQATINVSGALAKAFDITPFSQDNNWTGTGDEYATPDSGGVSVAGKPHTSDDIIFGGLGNDFLHGGSGDDAISGAEALPMAAAGTPSQVQPASVGGIPGVVVVDNLVISGFSRPYNPGNILSFNPVDLNGQHAGRTRAGEFALYDEYNPLRKIELAASATGQIYDFLLNFDDSQGILVPGGTTSGNGNQSVTYGPARNDGADAIFGDLGNDWLVGGTGRDDMFGGFGNDLMNADDNMNSTAGTADPLANNVPDTQPSFEDRAVGGGGRDVLIANTGGDRLMDWTGEFNSFLVPFAPFGMATVSRTMQPQLHEFLVALSHSDGADPTVPLMCRPLRPCWPPRPPISSPAMGSRSANSASCFSMTRLGTTSTADRPIPRRATSPAASATCCAPPTSTTASRRTSSPRQAPRPSPAAAIRSRRLPYRTMRSACSTSPMSSSRAISRCRQPSTPSNRPAASRQTRS